MPAKMMMTLTNSIYTNKAIAIAMQQQQAKPVPAPSALTSSMIGRIHHARPGCGSCGK
jgi:hypothetical protein